MEKRKMLKNFKMANSIISCSLLVLSLSPSEVLAQFNKYKSKTDLSKKASTGSRPTSIKKPLLELEENSNPNDQFGRSQKMNKKIKVNDNYVTLNPETAFGPEIIEKFEFNDVSLQDLTKHMQKLTGINLIIDKELKGKITISASTAITVGDAWRAYLSALNTGGYSLIKKGAFYSVVQTRDIRYTTTKIYQGDFIPNTENYIMKIFPLENISVKELTRSFRPFMTRYGRIIDVPQTNTVIIQDTGTNVNRLASLIKFIDVPGHELSLEIIPVKNSSAQEIAKLLQQILKEKGKKGKAKSPDNEGDAISNIIAEPRTNSIIAMATASGAKQLKDLIAKLDIEGSSKASGQIHVYYLNYGDSETLSKTLNSLVSGNTSSKKGSRFTKNKTDDDQELFTSEVKITADKENNAIVVTASSSDWVTVKSVIEKLDIPRDQVYVEGMIMETQVNRGSGLGVSIVGAYGDGAAEKVGFTGGSGGQDLINLLTNNITSLGGLFIGGQAGSTVDLNVGGQTVSVGSVNALITAIANNSNTNVLATPQILALDNTEASFEVGESVPVTEQTIANNQTQVSVRQQKAGLTLKITPQINKVTRFVKLKIDQKIEEFQARANASAAGGLATTNRAAVTTVVVRDRDTIAMGGLMRDQAIESVSKVPLLGDIPIFGWLFKNTTKTMSKVNLLFFLTPQIMDDYQKDTANLVKEKLTKRAMHLNINNASDDPYAKNVKTLYEKAKKQEKGALYSNEAANRYKSEETIRRNNNSIEQDLNKNEEDKTQEEIENDFEESFDDDFSKNKSPKLKNQKANYNPPSYDKIIQKVKLKKSAQKK